MPINRKYPLAELMAALPRIPRRRQRAAHHLRIRDAQGGQRFSAADAHALARLVKGIPAKFNLIPFNRLARLARTPARKPEAMKRFAEILNDAGYSAPIRVPRGRDIMAACGQLRSATLNASGISRLQGAPRRRQSRTTTPPPVAS